MATYSQYSYYQRQEPVASSATSFSSQQSGLTWNGNEWVSTGQVAAAPSAFTGSYVYSGNNSAGVADFHQHQSGFSNSAWDLSAQLATATNGVAQPARNVALPQAPPPAPPAPPGQPPTTGNEDPATLVTRFSHYYQHWTAKAAEQRQKAALLPPGSEKDEAARMAQWADYYADQSSRSAHHYNTVQQDGGGFPRTEVGTVSERQEPPLQAKIEPVLVEKAKPISSSRKSRWSQPHNKSAAGGNREQTQQASTLVTNHGPPQPVTALPSGPPPPGGPPPDGLKRYVHRCLLRCTTDQQRTDMQKEVELVISQHIRGGTMHSIDWDNRALIPIPGMDTADQTKGNGMKVHGHTAFSSLSPDEPPQPNRAKLSYGERSKYEDRLPPNNSYYGMSKERKTDHGNTSSPRRSSSFGKERPSSGIGGGSFDRETDRFGGPTSTSRENWAPRNGDSSKGGNNFKRQQLLTNDSYYGNGAGGNSSVCSDDRSLGCRSIGSEQDFISLSGGNKRQKKNKTQQKQLQNHKRGQKKYQRHNSNDLPGSKGVRDGFERSSAALAKRASRFSGRGGIADAGVSSSADASIDVERYMGKTVIGGNKKKLDETDFERMTVKGTCLNLEKDYLRLTAPPRAELVRPKPILEKHLLNLKKLWGKAEEDRGGTASSKRDYLWFCSQFKALRQDLTVQRIFDPFTCEVYETHARIALEQGDLNEYNQCQTQLKELYEQMLSQPKNVRTDGKKLQKTGLENQNEFIAYRIIYYVYLTGNKKYEGGSSDLFKIMLSLTPGQREDPFISHALNVRVAVAEFDYHAFFRLHDACPNMGAYLMDYLVPQVRQAALQRIHKAYRPAIEVAHVLSELGFDTNDTQDHAEGKKWLLSCGCKVSDDGKMFLTKESVLTQSDMLDKKSSLI